MALLQCRNRWSEFRTSQLAILSYFRTFYIEHSAAANSKLLTIPSRHALYSRTSLILVFTNLEAKIALCTNKFSFLATAVFFFTWTSSSRGVGARRHWPDNALHSKNGCCGGVKMVHSQGEPGTQVKFLVKPYAYTDLECIIPHTPTISNMYLLFNKK